jgi:hypothetical protein
MLVFIDESGDAGFPVEAGASPVFVAAMVVFADAAAAAGTQKAIEASEARRRHKPEFKFSKTRDEVRDAFFETVRARPFAVRAIVVDKARVRSPALTAGNDRFYEFFLGALVQRNAAALIGARVLIDGSGSRAFRSALRAALRQRLPQGALRSLEFKDSRADVLIQLADMCAGAIARSYKADRTRADRWLDALRSRIEDIWEFP